MFSKSAITKPVISHTIPGDNGCTHYICNAEFLHNGLVLIGATTRYIANTHTSLYLYDPQKKMNIDKKKFLGQYAFWSLNEDKFLLVPVAPHTSHKSSKILVLCKKTLVTKTEIPWNQNKIYSVIDGQLIDVSFNQTQWIMTFYSDDYIPGTSINLSKSIPEAPHPLSIMQLANGLITCKFFRENSLEMILFQKVNCPTMHLKEIGVITPQGNCSQVLHNGNILTYDLDGRNFQLWDEVQLVKSWKLKDIRYPGQKYLYDFPLQGVYPMIDGKHLIIKDGFGLLLHNMDTCMNKRVDLVGFSTGYNRFHVLPTGQTLILSDNFYDPYFLLAEFKEIQDFKKMLHHNLNKTDLCKKYGLLKEKLPYDLTQKIFRPLILEHIIYKAVLDEQQALSEKSEEEKNVFCFMQ